MKYTSTHISSVLWTVKDKKQEESKEPNRNSDIESELATNFLITALSRAQRKRNFSSSEDKTGHVGLQVLPKLFS